MMSTTHFFENALLGGVWLERVKIDVSSAGVIESVESGVDGDAGASMVYGYAMPGIPNIHSHAFQRAMRGLAEYSRSPRDSFWNWRDLMYRFANLLTPGDLETIASQLYVEMVKAGYTSVAEFHYLHHQRGGTPYDQPAEMSLAVFEAARSAGIGLTHLPVLYMAANFDGGELSQEQARFGHALDGFLGLLEALQGQLAEDPQMRLGCAMQG